MIFIYLQVSNAENELYKQDGNNNSSSRNNKLSPLAQLRVAAMSAARLKQLLATPNNHNQVESKYASTLQKMEEHVEKKSCRRRSQNLGTSSAYSLDPSCPNDQPVIYYNPLNRPRYLCGGNTLIYPKSTLQLNQACNANENSPFSRLFPVIPDRTGQGMPPIRTAFNSQKNYAPFTDCDIPCHSAGQPSTLSKRTIEGTPWSFVFSMEGAKYYSQLEPLPTGYQNDKFWSTTSYRSEVPLPYYSRAEYTIQSPGLSYDKAIKGAVFLARNCHSQNNREAMVQKLIDSKLRVDSLSSCLHNANAPPGVNLGDKKQVMQNYLFYLAFENQNTEDYITEKLWGPLEAGTVPIYYGAPNVKEHAPNRSLILIEDFSTIDELADYVVKVANDKNLYESYQTWRTQPLPPHFHQKYDFTQVHSTCRTCRWAYARLYGLGWNHANQSLVELNLPRQVCLDKKGNIQRPFVEEWYRVNDDSLSLHQDSTTMESSTRSSCQTVNASNRVLVIDDGDAGGNKLLRRTIYEQDGAIDMIIEGKMASSESRVLRLRTSLAKPQRRDDEDYEAHLSVVRAGQYRLQNKQSRLTVLTQPRTLVSKNDGDDRASKGESGTIDLLFRTTDLPVRLRIIVEDIDTFHVDADKRENYFAESMIEDFYNPVEGFVVK